VSATDKKTFFLQRLSVILVELLKDFKSIKFCGNIRLRCKLKGKPLGELISGERHIFILRKMKFSLSEQKLLNS